MRLVSRSGLACVVMGACVLVLILLSGGSGLAQGAQPTALPDDPARPVVERLCTSCHELVIGEKQRYSRERWAELVDQMSARGMEGSSEDVEIVVNYLAKYFGPEPPASHK
jgi:hypothetical protein